MWRALSPVWRGAVLAVLTAMTLIAGPVPARGATSLESQLHQLVNGVRASSQLPQLSLSERLSRMAHRHSRHMAQKHFVYHHGCLSCHLHGFSVVGENVGAGQSIVQVHGMMLASPGHAQNVLGLGYNRVGIGVVKRGRHVWVTQIFYG